MYKFSISKELFDDILLKKIKVLEKENTNYWKKELLEPIIIDDKLTYKIKQFEKFVRPIDDCIKNYCIQNQKLTELKELLLSRLATVE